MKTIAPYGSWKSKITAEFVSGKERDLTDQIQVDGDEIYFLESRPDEGGRSVLMVRSKDGQVTEVLPKEFNVRTRYLEYGGSRFLVHKKVCYFVNYDDQEIYSFRKGQAPMPLTSQKGNRFSDLILDERRNRLIALREIPGHPESKNTVCTIDLKTGNVEDLISGKDFYICPRLSPDGNSLLWIQWSHPNMAWNGTELWTASIDDSGKLSHSQKRAGDSEHAVCQAQWGAKNELYFIAELKDWFNLYRLKNGTVENLYPCENEFAYPDWAPGAKQYALCPDGSIYATYLTNGRSQLLHLQPDQSASLVGKPFAMLSGLQPYQDGVIAFAAESTNPPSLIFIDANNQFVELYRSQNLVIAKDDISIPEEVEFPTEDGQIGYAWSYSPKNSEFSGPADEKPPLIVRCHGGPTAQSFANFKKEIQFWTNRGYAVVDVNYGGSTGYGRNYRERLRMKWGVVDVSDCVAVVRQLAKQGQIDPKRVAIRGGSAGGYTTLAALAFTEGVFAVGSSYFGISELEMLAKETHKLESRYMDQLIGRYPEDLQTYKQRSPIEHVQNFNCPIAFFQGDEDKVVPPNQSELMFQSLKKKGIYTEYHLYAGEGHGFRRSENVQHSLKAEHSFYAKFFGFQTQPQDSV